MVNCVTYFTLAFSHVFVTPTFEIDNRLRCSLNSECDATQRNIFKKKNHSVETLGKMTICQVSQTFRKQYDEVWRRK